MPYYCAGALVPPCYCHTTCYYPIVTLLRLYCCHSDTTPPLSVEPAAVWLTFVVPVRRVSHLTDQLGDGPERVEAEPGELCAGARLAAARRHHQPLPAQTERPVVPEGAPAQERRPQVSGIQAPSEGYADPR